MSAERGKADGVRAFSFHPGTILDTGLAAHVSSEELRAAGVIKENAKPIRNPARNLKAVEQGVRDEPTARRNGRSLLRERGHPHSRLRWPATGRTLRDSLLHEGLMPYAVDPKSAERLWVPSEQFVGLNLR
jgi:hypothetical protein